jgi:beta-galactosidase
MTSAINVRVVYTFFFLLAYVTALAQQSSRQVIDFTKDWKFNLGDAAQAESPSFNDKTWRSLDVPHDWSVEGSFDEKNPAGVGGGALPGGIGWYRKTFATPANAKSKLAFVEFDGVYRNSEVWINGHYLGKRPNGYISFQYEISPYLNFSGPNLLAVKVDNSSQPNSRWYSGSGIYRNVRLLITDPVHIGQWGVHIATTNVSVQSADIAIKTTVNNDSKEKRSVHVTSVITDPNGKEVARLRNALDLSAVSVKEMVQHYTIKNPSLWSLEKPNLYHVISSIETGGKETDQVQTSFGVRYFEFDPNHGFSLNGKQLKIKGVCNHHDLGCLGTAINVRALERQIEIMKGMGVNSIRTSHNPPAPELLDLCDRMGILIMDEMFDMWKKKKTEFDYSLDWDQWHRRDLQDFILRDRNHPSVIIWSIGNEILEQWDSTGTPITKELVSIVKELDSSRPVTTANNGPSPTNKILEAGVLDLIGYNYNHNIFTAFPSTFPGQKFIATETTSALATRGHYDMPSDSIGRWPIAWDKPFNEGNPDFTVSAYGNVSAPWGSTHEETWKVMKKHDFLSGMYIWTGFDYLGEPTPYGWPARSSYFGVIDLAGFPKDAYYLYQSEWTNTPVLHVFPHWNWKEGQTIDVWAYYNQADEVELFLNGKSLGSKSKTGDDLHVMWRLKFVPGVLKAVSRKNGKEVLTREIRTAGKPSKLVLKCDHKNIKADGKDLSFITVEVLDENNNIVPDADDLVSFEVDSNGRIAGVDNGDPVSHESFKAKQRKAFHGKCLLVIQSRDKSGIIQVKASASGLSPASIEIKTEK